MKKIGYLIFIFGLISSFGLYSQSRKESKIAGYTIDNYEVECLGTGKNDTELFKIWGYGRKQDDAVIQAKRNAVHAIIFKGISTGIAGCSSVPIISDINIENNNLEFFNNFFDKDGEYLKYVEITGEGAEDVIKVNTRMYKVSLAVSVNRGRLNSYLIQKKILKAFGSQF
jgi:hypothetical protein